MVDAQPRPGQGQRQSEQSDEQKRTEQRKSDRQEQGAAQSGVTAGPSRREDDDQHRRRQTQTTNREPEKKHRPNEEEETTPGYLSEAVLRDGGPQCQTGDHQAQYNHQYAEDGREITWPHTERGARFQLAAIDKKARADGRDNQATNDISWFLNEYQCCVLPLFIIQDSKLFENSGFLAEAKYPTLSSLSDMPYYWLHMHAGAAS
jgi:hypothetical protein